MSSTEKLLQRLLSVSPTANWAKCTVRFAECHERGSAYPRTDVIGDLATKHQLENLREEAERLIAQGAAQGLLEVRRPEATGSCTRGGRKAGQGLAHHLGVGGRHGSRGSQCAACWTRRVVTWWDQGEVV